MKLLFACADRADDPNHWSGIVWNSRRALEASGVTLAIFDQIPFECPLPLRMLHHLHRRLKKKTHYLQIEPAILQRSARRIEARFAEGDCDAVFCLGTGVPVHTYVTARIPVFTYLDATKRSWISTYLGLETLSARSRRHVEEVDRVSLHHNALTIFASDWARDEAVRDYALPMERVAVVPLGANLHVPPTAVEVENALTHRSRDTLRLLFLGKEWERKGGPDAIALARELRVRGINLTIDIVGCTPSLTEEDEAFARIHGFVDHSTPAGRDKLHALLRETHLLLFLSHAEAYGIALCEAAAFGVPAVARNVGGIPTIVRDGANGWLAPESFPVAAMADRVAEIWRTPSLYLRVARAARADYEARLNWTAAGLSLKQLMSATLAARGTAR